MKQASLGSFFSITPAKKKPEAATAGSTTPVDPPASETPDSSVAGRAPPPRKGRAAPVPAKHNRRKRALDEDDEAFEVELFSESDGEAAAQVDESDDGALPASALTCAASTGTAAMLKPAESARAIPVDAALLAAYGIADAADVEPLLTAEPAFAFDEKQHQAFVKRLRLQQNDANAAKGGVDADDDDDASLGSPLAQCTKRPGVKYTPLELQFLAVKEKHPDTVLFVECGYKVGKLWVVGVRRAFGFSLSGRCAVQVFRL